MNIIGKKIVLRAIEEEDLEILHKWSNEPELQNIMGDIHAPSSYSFHKKWYQNIDGDSKNYRLAIDSDELGIIGMSTIINIDWRNKHAWHGIYLGNKNIVGKGYGIDAVMTTMKYAFEELQMERLDGSMIEYNEASINFYCNKLGWKKEGQKKRYYFRNGKYWDQIIVGITKEEYTNLIKCNKYWDCE